MTVPERIKILMIGYLPPPYFGPSTTYTTLLNSEFVKRFDVTFLDITVAKTIRDLEKFRIGKIFKMIGFLLRECWLLDQTSHRVEVVGFPAHGRNGRHAYRGAEVVRSSVLPDFSIPAREFFE